MGARKDDELREQYAGLSTNERNVELVTCCGDGPDFRRSVDVLLDLGCDVNARAKGSTPLIAASARRDSGDLVDLLLKRGAKPNVADRDGESPLTWAAWSGSANVCKRLLASGADPNHRNARRETALLRAIKGSEFTPGCVEVVELLVRAKADVEAEDADGRSPLFRACALGALKIVEQLLDAGSGLDDGPLLLTTAIRAAKRKPREAEAIVRLLLDRGASPDETSMLVAKQFSPPIHRLLSKPKSSSDRKRPKGKGRGRSDGRGSQ